MLASSQGEANRPPKPNEVLIGPNGVIMPLNKIVLVRKGKEYCAVKFTEFWTGKTEKDMFARYESYYQRDGSENFTSKNIEFRTEELAFPKPRGIGRLVFSFGNRDIKCGPIRLWWAGKGTVYFFGRNQAQGDYGIELAPTKWTNISQVNIFDSLLKWYRYDEKRKRRNIQLDQLWDDKP